MPQPPISAHFYTATFKEVSTDDHEAHLFAQDSKTLSSQHYSACVFRNTWELGILEFNTTLQTHKHSTSKNTSSY